MAACGCQFAASCRFGAYRSGRRGIVIRKGGRLQAIDRSLTKTLAKTLFSCPVWDGGGGQGPVEATDTLWDVAKAQGFNCVLEGSTASDLSEHRPGVRAVAELGVRSPLQEAGLTKDEIRRLSKEAGLPTWNKPPMACLASRFPYHSPITEAALRSVAQAERSLRALGLRLVRVRHHDTNLIRRHRFTLEEGPAPVLNGGSR